MTVRVLVVDDSRAVCAAVRRALAHDGEIDVIGTADSAQTARAMIKALNPDVLTLDIEMPGMNGLDFLEKIMRLRPMPVVMLSALTDRGAETTIRALELGAFECCWKPGATIGADVAGALSRTIRAAARSRTSRRAPTPALPPAPADYAPRRDSLIAIGASTGGVEALIELLAGFPAQCPPTVIVQHMPAPYVPTLAKRLDRLSRPQVREAFSGALLEPGHVYIAPGGPDHLEVAGGSLPRCRLIPAGKVSGHRPSVDRLFLSVARAAGASAVGAILTGMGADGAAGLLAMRNAGALTIGQDEDSCVVYGMSQAAHRIGAVAEQLALPQIAPRLMRICAA